MDEEVVRRQLRVVNPLGVHARPAALLVQLANKFHSEIGLIKGVERVDAKSVLQLMTLAAEQGTVLVLEASGSDAISAADAMEKLFNDGFGELDTVPPTG